MTHLCHFIYGVIDIVLLEHKHYINKNEYRFKIDLYSIILILKFITMKTFLKTLIILLIGVSFSSCDDIESLADIEFTTSFSGDVDVVVPASVSHASAKIDAVSFSGKATIDPQSDSNIKKYIDKLKSSDVQEVTGTFKKVSKPVRITTGSLSISQGSKSASWSIKNFDVANGAKIILDSAEGQWATINQILMSKNKFDAKITGTVDNDDVSFTVTIYIKSNFIANPLK